jgi:hypothetical protein
MILSANLSLEWILSAIGFSLAFTIGLWQYIRAQRQEKVGLILPLITEFETDETLKAARHLFDFDAGIFSLNGQEHKFCNKDILESMAIVEQDEWPPQQELIRKILDRYFDFFGKLDSFIEIKLLKFRDLKYFYYYFELLAGIDKYKGSGFEERLKKYLDTYHFVGCRSCLDQYRRLPRSQRTELQLSPPAAAGHRDYQGGEVAQ